MLTCYWSLNGIDQELNGIEHEQECQLFATNLQLSCTSELKERIFRLSLRYSIHQMLSVTYQGVTGADCQLSIKALSYHIATLGNAASQ